MRSDLVTLSATKSSKWTALIGRAGRLSTLSKWLNREVV